MPPILSRAWRAAAGVAAGLAFALTVGVAPAAATANPELFLPAVVDGPAVTVASTGAGQRVGVTFTATAGQWISVVATNSVEPTWKTMFIEDSAGAALAPSKSCSVTACLVGTFQVRTDGVYRTGTYTYQLPAGITLRVLSSPTATATAEIAGPAVPVTTTVPGQAVEVAFAGGAGKRLAVRIDDAAVGGSVSEVRLPGGSVWACREEYQLPSFCPAQVVGDGTHVVRIQPKGVNPGTVTVRVYEVPEDLATPLTYGPAVTVATSGFGQNFALPFEGRTAQSFAALITGHTARNYFLFTVLDPTGQSVGGWWDCFVGAATCEVEPVVLPRTGTYTLVVDFRGGDGAAMDIQLFDILAQPATPLPLDGTPTTATILAPETAATFSVTVPAGRRVSLWVERTGSGPIQSLVLAGPGGVAASCSTPRYDIEPDCLAVTGTLLYDGGYTLAVIPLKGRLGPVTVRGYDITTTPVPLTVGTPTTFTVDRPGHNPEGTFTGTAGQRISVAGTAGTFAGYSYLRVRQPGGALAASALCYQQCLIDSFALPATGQYTVEVDPQETDRGTQNVLVSDTADLTAPVTPGGPAVPVVLDRPGRNAVLSFPATAGQRVAVQFSGGTFGAADATVTLRRPDGGKVSSNVSCGATCFLDTVALPTTGTYTVLVDPEYIATGAIDVRVHDVGADVAAATTPGGAAVTVSTTVPGRNAAVTFPGTAGQRVSVRLSGGTYGSHDATVVVRRPDGTSQAQNISCGATCFFDTFALPATGTYTVLVDPEVAVTGAITAQVYDVTDQKVTVAPNGTAANLTLAVPGGNGSVEFAASAGDRVSVKLTAAGFGTSKATTATLRGPANEIVGATVNCGTSCFFEPVLLTATGTYTVVVDPAADYTGTMAVQAYVLPADTVTAATVGGPGVVATVDAPGQRGTVTFTATAGQVVTVGSAAANFGASTVYTLRAPDGSVLATKTASGATANLGAVTVPVAGVYTLVIDPSGAATGRATVTVR
ncbi:PPC domain-containing protein [Longispora urticae]